MKRFIFMLLVLLFSVACQEIVVVYPPIITTTGQETPDGSIQFGNYTPATKAMAGEGPNGVGYGDFTVFGFEDNTPIMDPYFVIWQESQWVYEGVSSQELKYFNKSANQYSFIGIISDNTPSRDGTTVNVSDVESFQTTDPMNSPKELLYTQKIVPQSQFGKYVSLTFNHANARMFIGFASDRSDTEVIDYVPGTPSVPGTITTEHAKMFDLLAEGKLVGYGLTKFQGDEHGEYRGYTGNYFNINPYQGGLDFISNERLAELMPIVNAQFIYTDENCNIVDHWEYNVDKKDKMFLKFADGVNASDFIAGNDAFWTNLTDAEKVGLKNHHDSGCRIIRIEKLPDGNYFAWGESYGLVQNTTDRDFKVINGGTIGRPELEGIRVFSVDDSGSPIIHKVHTVKADAHFDAVNAPSYDNVVANSECITFNKPSTVLAQSDDTNITWAEATHSPTIRYALPIASTGYVVKFSYVYNGVTYYDARVLIPTESAAFAASKDYTYVIYITDKTNATTDPNQAYEEKNEVDTSQKAIVFSEITFGDYTSGGHYVYTIL